MADLEEELKIYRDVSSISGDVLFRYDFRKDVMHIIGGHKSSAGNGYKIANFVNGIKQEGPDPFLKNMFGDFFEEYKDGFPDFFDEKIKLKKRSGENVIYRVLGKKEYDDDWNEEGIVGKIVKLHEEHKEYGKDINDVPESGFMDAAMENNVSGNEAPDAVPKFNNQVLGMFEKALDIIAENGNIGDAVNELLKEIGDRYDLDCISIQEYNEMTGMSSPCIQWYDDANDIVRNKIARMPFDNFPIAGWKDNNTMVEEDLTRYTGDNSILKKMKDIDIHSVVICRYMSKGRDMGWVSFENHRKAVKWTDEEIEAFRIASKLISIYLIDMKSYINMLRKEERIKTHDTVTDLPKFDIFIKEAKHCINDEPYRNLAIIYYGISNLEKVNEIYGRAAGDKVLLKFAEDFLKIEDRYILGSRINASNFAVLVNQFDSRGNKISVALIDIIKARFENMCTGLYPEAGVSMSAGIVFLPSHVEYLENYISKARHARESAALDGESCGFAY